MDLSEVRRTAKTGDILLVEGRGVFPTLIRIFTAQQFSHAALILKKDHELLVTEMKEGEEDLSTYTLDEWLPTCNGKPFFGRAPIIVQVNSKKVEQYFERFKATDPQYGYFSLIKVWISQWTGIKLSSSQKVCSTYVQAAWQAAGYNCDDFESPGGLLDHLQALYDID